jgi:hypothetical protein
VRNSVYKVLTAIILLGLLIPVAIPQGTASADNPSVTLDFFKKLNLCNDNSTTIYVQSNETIGCNVTVSGYTGTAAYAKLQFYISGSWVDEATATISAPSGATKMTFLFTIPSGLSAGSYQVRVGVADSGLNFAYSGNGTIIIDNTAPTAPTLASPANGAYSSTATPTFQWNTVSDATYYTLVIDGTDNQTCLTGNTATPSAAMTKASHTWTVKSLDAAGNSTTAAETRTICIDTDAPSAPSNSSWPGDGLTFNYSPTCNWTVSTDTSTCTIIRYVVETSTSSSQWDATTVVDNVTVGTNSYTRNAVLPAGTYYWRVRAYDSVGNWSTFSSTKSYTIAAGCTSFTISLNPGWNLISLPLTPTSTVVTDVLGANVVSKMYTSGGIYYLNYGSGSSAAPGWKWWTPDRGLNMTTAEAGKAYWINVTDSCSFTVTGTPCGMVPGAIPTPVSYPLYYSSAYPDGWNMLGFKSCQPMKASAYLSNLTTGSSTAWSSLWRWAGTWVQVQPDDDLVPGTGYYIRMNASGSVIPPCY